MASALGRPGEQCVGRGFGDLLSEDQRISARSLLAHGATTKRLAMRVLEFPGWATRLWSALSKRGRYRTPQVASGLCGCTH
ncbi:hypothetical protein [Streptomyces sp. NPDC001070]